MTARPVPRHWNRFTHLKPYRRNNSPQAVVASSRARGGPGAIDLDAQPSRDGYWMNTHWARLSVEGFRYTRESVAAGACTPDQIGNVCRKRVRDLTWQQIATLRTRDGYRIPRLSDQLALASDYDVRVEVEPKFTPTPHQINRLRIAARRHYGRDWQRFVQVKRLTFMPGWRATLERAKAAGFTTIALRVRFPSRLPDFVDYYRK